MVLFVYIKNLFSISQMTSSSNLSSKTIQTHFTHLTILHLQMLSQHDSVNPSTNTLSQLAHNMFSDENNNNNIIMFATIVSLFLVILYVYAKCFLAQSNSQSNPHSTVNFLTKSFFLQTAPSLTLTTVVHVNHLPLHTVKLCFLLPKLLSRSLQPAS